MLSPSFRLLKRQRGDFGVFGFAGLAIFWVGFSVFVP